MASTLSVFKNMFCTRSTFNLTRKKSLGKISIIWQCGFLNLNVITVQTANRVYSVLSTNHTSVIEIDRSHRRGSTLKSFFLRRNVDWHCGLTLTAPCSCRVLSKLSFSVVNTMKPKLNVLSCTYRRTLGSPDSRQTSIPLHASGSRCARRALDARLASISFRSSSASFSGDTHLGGK